MGNASGRRVEFVPPGRAVGRVRGSAASAERLRALGWGVLEVEQELIVDRVFRSLEEAKTAATTDLPPRTTVHWSGDNESLSGGFIVGFDAVAPPLAGIVPAYVLWPDGSQDFVETVDGLVGLLRERLEWLVDLARASFPEGDVEMGRATAIRALEVLAVDGTLRPECCGPFFDVRCAASVEPVGLLRWGGFADGWDEPDGPPASERLHPSHYTYDGDFRESWRAAVDEGIAARRRS
jgi:hypothetical protein